MLSKLKYNILGNVKINHFTSIDSLVEKLRIDNKESNIMIKMDIYERLILEILMRE